MGSGRVLTLGAGSAYANDRLEPAAAMADSGRVSYLGFDCLAERTMALAQVRRRRDPAAGQDERIDALVPLLAGYLSSGRKVVGNFGAANPDAACADFARNLRAVGLSGTRIGVIRGDDVRDLVRDLDLELLECGVHSTGGNFEDPPYRVVPNPHDLGFPLAEVEDGSVVVTKLDGTGGAVDERTMKTQVYYEIHDPAAYLTPDVTADFSTVSFEDLGGDRVRLGGARGRPRPTHLKVLVGVNQGWKATGEMSYGGPGCVERARRA